MATTRTIVDQLRIVGFDFATDETAGSFALDCRTRGLRAWHQRETVAVVVDDVAVEAEVRIAAQEAGGSAAG